jgi:hypothetical protein
VDAGCWSPATVTQARGFSDQVEALAHDKKKVDDLQSSTPVVREDGEGGRAGARRTLSGVWETRTKGPRDPSW